jgi:hypothetical protein
MEHFVTNFEPQIYHHVNLFVQRMNEICVSITMLRARENHVQSIKKTTSSYNHTTEPNSITQ